MKIVIDTATNHVTITTPNGDILAHATTQDYAAHLLAQFAPEPTAAFFNAATRTITANAHATIAANSPAPDPPPANNLIEAQANRIGFSIVQGAHTGTTDDRIDRWYIQDNTSPTVDRRGPGYPTRGDALHALLLTVTDLIADRSPHTPPTDHEDNA